MCLQIAISCEALHKYSHLPGLGASSEAFKQMLVPLGKVLLWDVR